MDQRRATGAGSNYSNVPWMKFLSRDEARDSSHLLGERFRDKFRATFNIFETILEKARETQLFPDETAKSERGKPPCVPMGLRIRACLRLLTLGCGFDGVTEAAGMGESTVRHSFHKWIKWMRKHFYDEHVKIPSTKEEIDAEVIYYFSSRYLKSTYINSCCAVFSCYSWFGLRFRDLRDLGSQKYQYIYIYIYIYMIVYEVRIQLLL